ncbi:MAG: hypothetical protein KJP23_15650 [Deltaproteobacteria bacterium]|nr:hypothetical protein [Deltaproteobacteria bacterium]
MKALASFKKQAIIAVALLGFVVDAKWDAWSMTFNLGSLTVVQVETQTNGNDEKTPSPVSTEPKSKPDEKKEATGIKEKPLKDFKPSEKIEAEQAVDFPYDI